MTAVDRCFVSVDCCGPCVYFSSTTAPYYASLPVISASVNLLHPNYCLINRNRQPHSLTPKHKTNPTHLACSMRSSSFAYVRSSSKLQQNRPCSCYNPHAGCRFFHDAHITRIMTMTITEVFIRRKLVSSRTILSVTLPLSPPSLSRTHARTHPPTHPHPHTH